MSQSQATASHIRCRAEHHHIRGHSVFRRRASVGWLLNTNRAPPGIRGHRLARVRFRRAQERHVRRSVLLGNRLPSRNRDGGQYRYRIAGVRQ